MNPLSQQYRLYRRRSRLTGAVSGVIIATLLFLLHDWYPEFTGLPDRVLDTAGAALVIFGFIGVQRALSAQFYKDIRYGMKAVLVDERSACPSNEICKQVAGPNLRDVPRYTQVLAGHLKSVTEQTEQAAFDVTSRLQTIGAGG